MFSLKWWCECGVCDAVVCSVSTSSSTSAGRSAEPSVRGGGGGGIWKKRYTVEPLITDTPNSGHLRLTDVWPLHRPIFLYN